MTVPPRYDRPEAGEYNSFYAGYVRAVPDGDLIRFLESQIAEYTATLTSLPEAKGGFAYAPGKWTVKQVVCHVADAERVFAYRALRIGRGDEMPLPGFDENTWAPNSGANDRNLAGLVSELQAVRAATIALLGNLPAEAVGRRGTASSHPVTVRALAWIIAGHANHHLGILRERYLG